MLKAFIDFQPAIEELYHIASTSENLGFHLLTSLKSSIYSIFGPLRSLKELLEIFLEPTVILQFQKYSTNQLSLLYINNIYKQLHGLHEEFKDLTSLEDENVSFYIFIKSLKANI